MLMSGKQAVVASYSLREIERNPHISSSSSKGHNNKMLYCYIIIGRIGGIKVSNMYNDKLCQCK